ncbi:hypothetical protein [Chloroflexus islandicus]|uniref:hypothetical protein n=1 Tax=Chloroflexus islandicus TaxID=1707952 RepID=UPI000AECEAD0|nr:hypothetical protein [Chloroflexus islandicus]
MLFIVNENQLDEWVRAHAREAQGVIVELIYRLISASCTQVREQRFPLADSIGQHGPDGILEVATGFEPFVPAGRSFWEIGTGLQSRDKATADYNDLTSALPESVRKESTFIFVTPLSARRNWEYSWKEEHQAAWLSKRREQNAWKDIRIIDGTKLIDWIHRFPAVELWLSQKIITGLNIDQIETLDRHWELLRSIGDPPLTPQIFLMNRHEACIGLQDILNGLNYELVLTTRFPDQFVDFVAAYIASLTEDVRIRAVGRCLIVQNISAWNVLCDYREPLILIAHPNLEMNSENWSRSLQLAKQNGHSIVWSTLPGKELGSKIRHCTLPAKFSIHDLRKILEQSGYNEERARVLAERSAGNLSSLLHLLAGSTVQPKWSEHNNADDLAIALLVGSWLETSEADREAIESLAGQSYDQWTKKIRVFLLNPSPPLSYHEQQWRFVLRYEGWHTLGKWLSDRHLDDFQRIAVAVLQDSERYSKLLREGIAGTLALLGSHSKALISCSHRKSETTAILTVRAVLEDADSNRWARLDHLLPLLAEAAPKEFLYIVEQKLQQKPSIFDILFAQENYQSYIASTLWALEVLAWDEELFVRVILCLGELAARDPGGRLTNRPINSLTYILLPWLQQTLASMNKQVSAIKALLAEHPDVGLDLLIRLLSSERAFYTSRPTWREIIPDTWNFSVSNQLYWGKIVIYADLAISIAKNNISYLIKLIDYLKVLPLSVFEQFTKHLNSEEIKVLSDEERLPLWEKLVDILVKHSRFAGSDWAIPAERLVQVEIVADQIAPKSLLWRYKRLFVENDFDLHEKRTDYEAQQRLLQMKRQLAVEAVLSDGGVAAVIAFAEVVESPYKVGLTCGSVAQTAIDAEVLPSLLTVDRPKLTCFVEGFVRGRFEQKGWEWVDSIDISSWTEEQISRFLSSLPCQTETWHRLERLLGEEQSAYWQHLSINNAYRAQGDLLYPAAKLLRYGRPCAALYLLAKMLHQGQEPPPNFVISALLEAYKAPEQAHATDRFIIEELISWLQEYSEVNQEDLCIVEWVYLPQLIYGSSPKTLWQRLANDPLFFCQVIQWASRLINSVKSETIGDIPKPIAERAFYLLHRWSIPPGLRRDGVFDRDALAQWLDVVKEECKRIGYLEDAMNILGQALIHSPPDPDGLWIHRVAAEILNGKDANAIRCSFRIAIYNSRGAHFVDSTGQSERDLAAKYRAQADAVEEAGYSRLADTLRQLADIYDLESEWVVLRFAEEK